MGIMENSMETSVRVWCRYDLCEGRAIVWALPANRGGSYQKHSGMDYGLLTVLLEGFLDNVARALIL